MSSSSRSLLRLLTAVTAILLTCGVLSAANADQVEGALLTAVAPDSQLPRPVDVEAPVPPAAPADAVPAAPAAPAPEASAPAAPAATPTSPAPDGHAHAPAPARAPSAPSPAPAPAPKPAPRQDPPPAQEPTPAPKPAPAPEQRAAESDAERLERGAAAAIPAAWSSAISTTYEVIPGSTSWASSTGRISIARDHMADFDVLVDVIAHEFGHMIAFRYGSQAYAGAPPAGWPAPAHRPEEAWADCVQRVFVGRSNPSHGLAPCEGEQLRAAQEWLSKGPSAHKRTA